MSSTWSPQAVRALRGEASRAAFARQVGVTPNTIYRWELPDDAKESRRPRGAVLERLDRLAGRPAAPTAPAIAEDVADALVGVERIMRGAASMGRADLLRVVTSARSASIDARAIAAAGLALHDVLLRSDAQSALTAIAGPLVDAEQGRLVDASAALVHAVAALAHSLPDATLFDAGRVHAYAARAEELAHGDAGVSFLAWFATNLVAQMLADEELLARAFARRDRVDWSELPPLLALHDAEARSVRATSIGQHSLAARLREEVAAGAEASGYSLLLARVHALSAIRTLDELGDVESAIHSARRSLEIARAANASPGVHLLFAARALGEALFRAGRPEEALAALAELDTFTGATGLPPIMAVTTLARVYMLTGRSAEIEQLARSLRACEAPAFRAVLHVHARFVDAVALFAASRDPERTLEAFELVTTEARGWTFLVRECLIYSANAYLLARGEEEARGALRRARRFLDRVPSPWASAQLRRVEGAIVAAYGEWREARRSMESVIGTLEAGGDAADAAMARYLLAAIAKGFGDANGEAMLEDARALVARLGLKVPGSIEAGLRRFVPRRSGEAAGARADAIERLVGPLQRLAVRGAEQRQLARELVAIANDMLGTTGVELVEAEQPPAGFEGFEFGDGAGRTFQLGAPAPLDARSRAILTVLSTTAGLAFELAALRGEDAPRPAGDDDASLPGFVAASASMRAVRDEVKRLAASRATVVIQGESGAGKEVVARALHDLSTRAAGPYLPFNCAAVPRELFEGQLFGYRRGAFTGATRDHPGVLGSADGGTIFLDEIGELPLDVQPKLLRFLENGEIFPLGVDRPRIVDVRVIAATHRDLGAMVRDRRFREDLYYRLQVIALRIPPLRDRREDIAPLARRFLEQLSKGDPPVIAPDAMAKLQAHAWPGNVRELRNVIERAIAYSPRPAILRAAHIRLVAE
ncbi:MAG: sigma-54 dependent transcriptional regulator [Labilithrix sp.]